MAEGIQYSALIKQVTPNTRVNSLIARGTNAELLYLPGRELDEDPRYWLITDDGTHAILGPTGLIESVHRYKGDGPRTLLHRESAYGNFHTSEGVSLEHTMDQVYQTILGLEFNRDLKDEREVFDWRSEEVLARFGAFSETYDEADIIADYTDRMMVVKVSDGCPRHCRFCPEQGRIVLYTEDQIKQRMLRARELQLKYHSPTLPRMSEGFLNASDILWQHHMKGGVDPIKIRDMYYETFPETQKLYAFAGVPTVNRADVDYLKELFKGDGGINRILVGFESLDNTTLKFLSKGQTAEDTVRAMEKLHQTAAKKKYIIGMGFVGQGFYYADESGQRQFRSSREGLEKTIEILDKTVRKWNTMRPDGGLYGNPDQIEITRYVPVPGTYLAEMHEQAEDIVPHTPESLEQEVQWFISELRKRNIRVQDEYEVALEDRVRTAA